MPPFWAAILIAIVCAMASAIGTVFLGKSGYYTLVFAILFSVSMLLGEGLVVWTSYLLKEQRQNENKPVDNKPIIPHLW